MVTFMISPFLFISISFLTAFVHSPSQVGTGHINGTFLTHRSLSGCPTAAQGIKKPKFDDISVSVYPKGYGISGRLN